MKPSSGLFAPCNEVENALAVVGVEIEPVRTRDIIGQPCHKIGFEDEQDQGECKKCRDDGDRDNRDCKFHGYISYGRYWPLSYQIHETER